MPSDQSLLLLEAIERIWTRITDNAAAIGDTFERITESFYSKVIRPGDTVIDGGAHAGRHTIPLARLVGPHGQVLAFEPIPDVAEKLKRLLTATGLHDRVRLRPEALARDAGRQDFFIVQNMPEYSGLTSRQYVDFVPEQSQIQVDVTTIDAVVNGADHNRPLSFVKLDLESGEFRALQGAEHAFRAQGPCCVFENGLQSSAVGYEGAEFFGYFERLGYELYDILGSPVTDAFWARSGPWYFVAIPSARRDLVPLLWASALEELLASPWVIPRPLLRVDSSSASPVITNAPGIIGHLDHVETSIRLAGWVGDSQTGQPARSLMIAVDGQPVASSTLGRPRHDVVTATGQTGFARSGFDITFPAVAGQRLELFAEAADGTFARIGGAVEIVAFHQTPPVPDTLAGSLKALLSRIGSHSPLAKGNGS